MKSFWKIILILLIIAVIAECIKYLYKIGTAPEPHQSVNPFSIYHGKVKRTISLSTIPDLYPQKADA